MLNRFFGENTHRNLQIFGLGVLAIGIPLNKIVMSISMMFLFLNLILEADFKSYYSKIKSNKIYLLILGFFLLHIIGILWSNNMDYVLYDLRVKLPLLVIPTILAAKPLKKREHLYIILTCLAVSVVIITLINYSLYNNWIGNRNFTDVRGMSIFTSHIRFSLIIAFVIGILLYFIQQLSRYRFLLGAITIWLLYYTFFSQVLSGFIAVLVVFIIFGLNLFWKKNKWLLIATFGAITLFSGGILVWLFSPVEIDEQKYSNLETNTIEGNHYKHNLNVISPETNEPVLIYVCKEEIDRDWNKYSSLDIDGKDKKGQPLRETLIRYLSSKGMRKDAKAMSQLSKKEFKLIENGTTSVVHKGILPRFYGLKFQLLNQHNPNGHSLLQRLEFWKTGAQIVSENMIFGVGTGDIQDTFNQKYFNNNSTLHEINRRRSHNYFLTIWITFGLLGLVYFLWLHFKFIQFNMSRNEILGVIFMFIILASFLIEDTIESQTGVTFYALFYGLFSLSYRKED